MENARTQLAGSDCVNSAVIRLRLLRRDKQTAATKNENNFRLINDGVDFLESKLH
jgi:hypothetical protein